MAVSQTNPRRLQRLTGTAFCARLGQACPNEALTYHRGLLAMDASHDSQAPGTTPVSGPSWLNS